jgi:hypothetical protein
VHDVGGRGERADLGDGDEGTELVEVENVHGLPPAGRAVFGSPSAAPGGLMAVRRSIRVGDGLDYKHSLD